jgi:signal transduction histidine kinase
VKRVARASGFPSFRTKLLVAMMLVVVSVSVTGLYIAERSATSTAEQNLTREFRAELNRIHELHTARQAAILERCRVLARKSRIRAALEDGAPDLLYPSARDELRDILSAGTEGEKHGSAYTLRAQFYRFLGTSGAVIPPNTAREAGTLSQVDEARLALPRLPAQQQIGYLPLTTPRGTRVHEVVAMPIESSDSGEPIAALVLGFDATIFAPATSPSEMLSGIWTDGTLYLDGVGEEERRQIAAQLAEYVYNPALPEQSFTTVLRNQPQLLFFKKLNPDSQYPAAYEVGLYSLASLQHRKTQLRWQVLGTGLAVLAGGLLASHFIAGGFSRPVEKLAKTSEENRAARQRAEAKLEMTQEELQRSARFSADASHQLKTPVTVLRAGLEELLAKPNLAPEVVNEVAGLIHQTYRLNNVIDDLLLLSRMDAGRLQLDLGPVNLTAMIEGWVDDLSALPDAHQLTIRTHIPPRLYVLGEKRYTGLILQNLLENAQKYNRAGGVIEVVAAAEGDWVNLRVKNTGKGIPAEMQPHIFERFHRAAVGENIPGHGLGLNLARELARLHRGELMLAHSRPDDTVFEVHFRRVDPAQS